MTEHVFREVHPHEFEQHIQRAPQTDLDQERDYTGKKTYLNQDNTVGYSLRDDGYWGNLFSLVKGGGRAATQDAIARGALWGTAFDRQGAKNLIEYYKGVGMKPFAREKNWDEGGPDVVHVKFDHAPVPDEIRQKIEQGIARAEGDMVKTERRTIFNLMRKTPHPHAYEWHDGHTLHHKAIAKADLADEADVGKQFQHQLNEQVATVGVPTYAEYAKHYGTINKAIAPHGSAYNYRGLSDKINDLIKKHGYEVYYAGGKYGKPDLATKNYDTKHLMIYDPTPDSGGDQGDFEQTDNWRKVHELAHALTRDAVNNTIIPSFGDARYGERPRMGRLGKQRTLRDAMRAIHWEALAVQKQRELSEQLGVKIPDEAFNMEWNTNQHDATHRAVTGRFSEPRKEGFHPSSEPVPLEFSLGLARKAAEQMGIKGLDELKGMAKSEIPALNKALKDLPAPESSAFTGNDTVHNYTNSLPHDLRQQGYKLTVRATKDIFDNSTVNSVIEHPVDGIVAHVYGDVQVNPFNKIANIRPHAKGIHPDHQGKKLGFHAYEALLNHAHNQMNIQEMNPGVHSSYAEKVHRMLAEKHGFKTILPATESGDYQYSAPSANPNFPDTKVALTHSASLYKLTPEQIKRVQERVGVFRRMLLNIRRGLGMTKSEQSMDKYEKARELLKACWEGYEMVGTKKKGNRTVPNCVPKKNSKGGDWDREYVLDGKEHLNKAEIPSVDLTTPEAHKAAHGRNVFVYFNLHKKLWSVKDLETGRVILHSKGLVVENPKFKVSEAGRQRVLSEQRKNVHAGVVGTLNTEVGEQPHNMKRVSYNPYKAGHFYDSATGEPVHSGSHAHMTVQEKQNQDGQIVRIPHVHVHDAQGLSKDEKKYSKKVKNPETGREKTVKYGAKGYTIAPGTSRGDSYCARSAGQMKDHPAAAKNPNSPLRLSRKKWRCSGSKSTKKSEEDAIEVEPAEYLAKVQELLKTLRKL